VLGILPLLHHEFVTTGAKPTLVVSEAWRQIPEAIDYANTLIYEGNVADLSDAIKFCKSKFDSVRVTQVQQGLPFQHRHPSYQYDQWERAGYLDKWDTLPLVLPRRNWTAGMNDGSEFILYGDHSQSSPFHHKEDLATALKENFPQHSIMRLSSIRAPHALDLLALMDAAALIVCVDSMQLHLAKATTTPLIALVSDQPTRWQGSGFSKRFALHCRYGDFPRRKDELIRVAKNAIAGKPSLTATPMDTMKCGYNPSIIQFGDKLISVHRYHPKRSWKTKLLIHDGVMASEIIFPHELDEFTNEDARLFHHNGKMMLAYVLAKALPISNQFRCVVGYGMLVQREGRWHVEKHIQPKFRNNDWSGMVKNWCPFEHDGKIHFIWGNSLNEQVVIEVDGDKVTQEYRSPEPKWDYGEIRGGAIVRYGDKLLRFFHSRTGAVGYGAHGTFQYHVGASLMEATPPFKTVAVSRYPILSGDERYVPGCHHWKPSCALVFGAIKRDGKILISIGRNDSSSHLIELSEADLALT
jgi:predicted GH43/DUF377 family glycosyl hydrolase